MKVKQNFEITRAEVQQLLFWAMCGFTSSNGGTNERKISKTISKYAKLIRFKREEFPPMGVQSFAKLTGETFKSLKKELENVGYRNIEH